MIIEKKSYPRAALIGNPSDGYFGKTIAFVFKNFCAEVQLYQTPELEVKPQRLDVAQFDSIGSLAADVNMNGYYGGLRLLKASIKVFYEYCKKSNIKLDERNFTMRYKSNIPLRLGLAGSSAIITASMKAMMAFYGVEIPRPILANLVLSVEVKELGIAAGLQDRVAQAYESPVFMDFDKRIMEKQGYGNYEKIPADNFPPVYIAFRKNLSEGTEVAHNNLRARFNIGEKVVLNAMKEWASITVKLRKALEEGDKKRIHELINRNFDLRKSLIPITEGNLEMIDAARRIGASAKFTGSGGAIIGTYADENMYADLVEAMSKKEIEVLKPEIAK